MAVVDIERSDVCNGSIFDDFSGGRRLADVRFERGAIDDNVEELTGDRTKLHAHASSIGPKRSSS